MAKLLKSFTSSFRASASSSRAHSPIAESIGAAVRQPIIELAARYRERCGWRKYGLLRDDTIIETPVVKEAIRRLPSHLKDARTMRMKRALDLSMKQAVLPEELQPTEKDDIGYLVPYILEVEREWAYRRAFRLE